VEVEKPCNRPAEAARLATQHNLHDMTGDHASEVEAPKIEHAPAAAASRMAAWTVSMESALTIRLTRVEFRRD